MNKSTERQSTVMTLVNAKKEAFGSSVTMTITGIATKDTNSIKDKALAIYSLSANSVEMFLAMYAW